MNFRFLNETVTPSRNTRRESERYVAKETRHSVRCNIHDLLRQAFTLQESKRTIGRLFSVRYTFYRVKIISRDRRYKNPSNPIGWMVRERRLTLDKHTYGSRKKIRMFISNMIFYYYSVNFFIHEIYTVYTKI